MTDRVDTIGTRKPRSFRLRLVATTMAVLGLSMSILAFVLWAGAMAWLNHLARSILDQEMQEVASAIVTPDGTLRVDAYAWNEPHHVTRSAHVDPFYLQIFDPSGRLIRASRNIALFSPGVYPSRIMAASTKRDEWHDPLRTFRVDNVTHYYAVWPLLSLDGTRLGTVQLAREDPGIGSLYGRFALFLMAGLLLTVVLLAGLMWWSAGRVMGPLAQTTAFARKLSLDTLHERLHFRDAVDEETRQLAATLNELLDRLEKSVDEIRRFSSNAAHELLTPLTAIRGHVDVALRRDRDAQSYQKTLHLVSRRMMRFEKMVDGLLLMARLEHEVVGPVRGRVELHEVCKRVLDALHEAASQKGLELVVRLQPVCIHGDHELVERLVANLLENAIKFTETGSVSVSCFEEAGVACVEVVDTGRGMSPALAKRATERFVRASSHASGRIPGSGLGLALVDQITHWHGGSLAIHSEEEKGTRVRVQFVKAASIRAQEAN